MSTRRQQDHRRKTLRPHPTRDQIVDVMRSHGRPISATRLAEVTGKSTGQVRYHLLALKSAGVVKLVGEGRSRGTIEHFYGLVARNEEQLNDSVVGLQKLCGGLTLPSVDGGYPQPLVLDERAREELQALLDALRPKVQRALRAAAKRNGERLPKLR
jgi:DNA-binding transcriptional ArsR family regulator